MTTRKFRIIRSSEVIPEIFNYNTSELVIKENTCASFQPDQAESNIKEGHVPSQSHERDKMLPYDANDPNLEDNLSKNLSKTENTQEIDTDDRSQESDKENSLMAKMNEIAQVWVIDAFNVKIAQFFKLSENIRYKTLPDNCEVLLVKGQIYIRALKPDGSRETMRIEF